MAKSKIIVTHSGRFHADELFGVATLTLVFRYAKVVRTRNPEEIESAHIVLDVGSIYDESKDRFDHHQAGGAGVRESGIPYASFGLVWKKYGKQLCENDAIASRVEKYLVAPIDAMDNGVDLVSSINAGAFPVFLQDILFWFTPTWQEVDRTLDQSFFEALPFVKNILTRAIIHAKAEVFGEEAVVEAYEKSTDKRIIVLDKKYSYRILHQYSEPLFVVVPDSQLGQWKVQAVENSADSYKIRKPLPLSWAGKRDEDLQKETGVADAVFCHNARFMVVSKSKEGALKLAEIALN